MMSERTLGYLTDNVWAKISQSQKWEGERRALEIHLSVGWLVKWNSLWHYTILLSYNFIEWMISKIVILCLWPNCSIVQIRRDDLHIHFSKSRDAFTDLGFDVGPEYKVNNRQELQGYIKSALKSELKVKLQANSFFGF